MKKISRKVLITPLGEILFGQTVDLVTYTAFLALINHPGEHTMTAEKFKRKLTAILSADVKGYSRLMGADEEVTLRTLQEYKEVMASSIQHHRGRIVGG